MHNDILFFKIWRNIFINRIIFKYIRFLRVYNKIKLNRIEDIRDFPKREYFKSIIYDGTEELISGKDFPKGVQSIEISYDQYYCKQSIESQLSFGLKKFIFPNFNNRITKLLLFPSSVETVVNATFIKGNRFGENHNDNQPPILKTVIPSNIKSLSIFRCPNHQLSKWLSIPSSLTSIDLGSYWNNGNTMLEPNDLPNQLVSLSMVIIPPVFNIKKDCLPNQLVNLTLSVSSKQLSCHYQYKNENEIIFQSNSIPSTLRKLDISYATPKFIQPSDSFDKITWLKLNYFQNNENILTKEMFPPNLITLILIISNTTIPSNVLPDSITSLKLQDYDWHLENDFKFNDSNFYPSSLKRLVLNCKVKKSIKHINLPNTIENLKFGCNYNRPIIMKSISIPTSVTKLTINCNILIEDGVLPNSIKKLKFGEFYGFKFQSNQLVPQTTEILVLKSNQPIYEGFIPNQSLKVLKLIGNFDKPLNFQLPKCIEKLIIGNFFNQSLNQTLLPQSITF
ncbi:hypothetical protein ACTA71_004277 [Dictyostelium dimigraforme]